MMSVYWRDCDMGTEGLIAFSLLFLPKKCRPNKEIGKAKRESNGAISFH